MTDSGDGAPPSSEPNLTAAIEEAVESVTPLIQRLPPREQTQVREIVQFAVERSIHSSFQGPIPPPDILRQYDEVLPGTAERIIRLAEQQVAHRHKQEDRIVLSQVRTARNSQWMAFVLTIVLVVVGTFLAIKNHDTVAGIIFGTTIAALASVFAIGNWMGRKRQEEDDCEDEADEEASQAHVEERKSTVKATAKSSKKKRR
jgi:uncharacterized membrane protein